MASLIVGAQARHTKAKIRRDDRSLILVAQVIVLRLAHSQLPPPLLGHRAAGQSGLLRLVTPPHPCHTSAALWLRQRWPDEPHGVQLPAVEDRHRAQDVQDIWLPQVRQPSMGVPF